MPVLIVEDDRAISDLIAIWLSHHEHSGIKAYTCEQAIALLEDSVARKLAFHGIFLDMKLPDGSGHDVLAWLESHHAVTQMEHVPVVIVTAYEVPPNLPPFVKDVLRKPCTQEEILMMVSKHFDEKIPATSNVVP